jgi:hypothetical protein
VLWPRRKTPGRKKKYMLQCTWGKVFFSGGFSKHVISWTFWGLSIDRIVWRGRCLRMMIKIKMEKVKNFFDLWRLLPVWGCDLDPSSRNCFIQKACWLNG